MSFQIRSASSGAFDPGVGPSIDWSNPLTAGLSVFCCDNNGKIVDLVNGGSIATFGTSGAQSTPSGVFLKFPPSGWGYMPPLTPGLVSPFGGSAPYSSILGTLYTGGFGPGSPDPDCACIVIQDAGNSTATLFGFNSWPNGAAGNPNVGDGIAAIVNNHTNVFFNQVIVDNTFQTWGCAAVNSGQLDLYSDGVFEASHTGITTIGDGTVTNPQIMYNTATSDVASYTNGINGYVPYFMMWSRVLSAAEFLQMHQNPRRFLIGG